MKNLYSVLAIAALLGTGVVQTAQAKGCIKGAVVGGLAGHVAGGHTKTGVVAGCVIGHHEASKKAAEDAAAAHQNQTAPQPQ